MASHSLLHLTADVMRLRGGPQEFPYSPPLLLRMACVAVAVDVLAAHMLDVRDVSAARLIVSLAITFSLPWLVLSLRQHRARYVQTMLALLLTGIVFSLIMLPLAAWALSSGLVAADNPVPSPQQALFSWLILLLVIWKIVVTASIWRHALDAPFAAGVGVALMVFVAEFGIDRMLFGNP